MIFQALLIATSWFWTPLTMSGDIHSQNSQALVCHVQTLALCLAQLPESARQQLPDIERLRQDMGQRGAMARPIQHDDIAGVILLNVDNIPKASSALLNGRVYSLALHNTLDMTLRHELGHLAITSSNSTYLTQKRLTTFQHEWLADFYLFWSLAKAGQPIELAWQQYHRRNIGIFESVDAMSHWSTPMLTQLLESYSWQALAQFEDFDALIDECYPRLKQYNQDELNEYASLIQRLFGSTMQHNLPHYMFWRRPEMGRFIKPTVEQLMGKTQAHQWLIQQRLAEQILTEDDASHEAGHKL
ncbi:hypothetical protein [Shewanella sp. Isolate11]|uniref:hypothetical protein n=1 Tax=Shewanella sp. Isolate11 TaxID=2908530 RepID=UPI001EFD0C24|nr:hypothetical protein [Shewanella sp. Isolate11]MCG9697568.1 hypothetical protein [Shewanella sp. Isolate11]